MKTHLFGTWLLANLLHPVFFAVAFIMQDDDGLSLINPENIGPYFFLVIVSFLLSLPSLLICLPLGDWMNKTTLSTEFAFGVWLLLSPLIVLLNYIFIVLFASGGKISTELFLFAVPGMVAAVSASLLRYKSFFKTILLIKNSDNETTLV